MATEIPRKKSPRAPSIALDEALERTLKIYQQDRLHPSPVDVVAQHMGYKGANGGAALSVLASLRYYGLVDRPGDGVMAVSKDFEAYKFAPTEELRKSFLLRFLATPPLFAELLDRYASGMPSDSSLKYELIQRGFLPGTAGALVAVLKRSIEYVGVYEESKSAPEPLESVEEDRNEDVLQPPPSRPQVSQPLIPKATPVTASDDSDHDRIPVRLPGGRRAWLVIPARLYRADKQRLKAQIDLLLTEDEDSP